MEGAIRFRPRVWLFLCGLTVLAGCAMGAQRQAQTAAQRQAEQAVATTREAAAQNKACVAKVIANPEYAPLLVHVPNPDTGQHTMAQLTDETIPSEQDARLSAAWYDEATLCRGPFLSAVSTARPDLVPIFTDAYGKADARAVLIVERKITWAEAARRSQADLSDARQKIAAADQQWIADLNAANQAEMVNRQAAAAALIGAMRQPVYQPPPVYQPAPVPFYAIPTQSPRQTNCYQIGNMLNCSSH